MQNQIQNGISSSAVTPQSGYNGVIQQLENAIRTDARRLQYLIEHGVITQDQWNYLAAMLTQKAQALNACKQSVPSENSTEVRIPPQSALSVNTENPLDLFEQENPGFFEKSGREDVLNYIKGLDVDKDEISKIAKLIEGVENSAVESYLKKSAHEKSLNSENSTAKSKLTAYAQNAAQNGNMNRIFTREDIGRMSGEEFAKNEKLIMAQVKQGLIK